MPHHTTLAVALGFALATAAAGGHAAYIVDTGPGAWTSGGNALYADQALGATFEVPGDTVISAVEGWMFVWAAGTIRIDLYAGGAPSGTPLHTATSGMLGNNGGPAWYGVSMLSWAVAAGTYTLTYSVPTGPFRGAVPDGAPNPLQTEWYRHVGNGGWLRNDAMDMGLRVAAMPVPEPSTWALWALGLAAVRVLAARRWMRAS
jgi:hypothetical protein